MIRIAVTEYDDRNRNSSFEIMNEKRFLELYGQFDLDQVKKSGHFGDSIGQLRHYYARLVSTDGFEDSGYFL